MFFALIGILARPGAICMEYDIIAVISHELSICN
jgi:hypothetical protein